MALQSQTQRSLLLSFLVSIALSGAIGIFCLLTGKMGWFEERIIGSTAIFAGCSILAMSSAIAWERRLWYPIPSLAMGLVAIAFVWSLLLTWDALHFISWPEREKWVEKPTIILWITTPAFCLFSLLSLARLRTQWQWVRWATMACISVLAAMLISFVLYEPRDDFWPRIAGTLGIGAACGFIAVPILHRVSAIQLRQQVRTAPLELSLTCPRCRNTATLEAGRSHCPACNLRIHVEIEEDNCRQCGYPLYQLTSSVCPECGTPIQIEPPSIPPAATAESPNTPPAGGHGAGDIPWPAR